MRTLCLASGRHLELVSHEILAVASLYGESIGISMKYSCSPRDDTPLEIVDDPQRVGRLFRVEFATAVLKIICLRDGDCTLMSLVLLK
jgi:hypothetical protein